MTAQAKSNSKKKSLALGRRRGKSGHAKAANHSFYSDLFTEQELGLIAGFVGDPSLNDDIWMQRVLNRRLLTHTNAKESQGDGAPVDLLIKLAEALAVGTGRGARLMLAKRMLSGEAAEAMIDAITYGLQELNRDKGTKLRT